MPTVRKVSRVSHFSTANATVGGHDALEPLPTDEAADLNERRSTQMPVQVIGEIEDSELDRMQADALLLAGWTFELPELLYGWRTSSPLMSWYWRAPAKPGRKKGKRCLSTNQAYNAHLKHLKTNP